MSYRLSPRARTDLEAIALFIAEDDVDASLRVIDAFESAFERLAKMPGIGHTRPELTDRPLKFWSVYSYLIVYRPESAPLEIAAILHAARDLSEILPNL